MINSLFTKGHEISKWIYEVVALPKIPKHDLRPILKIPTKHFYKVMKKFSTNFLIYKRGRHPISIHIFTTKSFLYYMTEGDQEIIIFSINQKNGGGKSSKGSFKPMRHHGKLLFVCDLNISQRFLLIHNIQSKLTYYLLTIFLLVNYESEKKNHKKSDHWIILHLGLHTSIILQIFINNQMFLLLFALFLVIPWRFPL